jgi:cysteine desulfurase
MQGGSQERNRRAGTENVPGIVGAGEALRLAYAELEATNAHLRSLRDQLIARLLAIPGAHLTGHPTERLPNNASFCFERIEGESVLLNLDMLGIAASSGSACTSASLDPSHVLLAMGIPTELAHGSLRLTLGKANIQDDVDAITQALPDIIEKLRALAPLSVAG